MKIGIKVCRVFSKAALRVLTIFNQSMQPGIKILPSFFKSGKKVMKKAKKHQIPLTILLNNNIMIIIVGVDEKIICHNNKI